MALVFAAVAEERDGIGTELPVDVEARAANWTPGRDVRWPISSWKILGSMHVDVSRQARRDWHGSSSRVGAATAWVERS